MAGVSRRRLLATGGAAALAGTLLAQNSVSAQRGEPRSPWQLAVDVAPDMSSLVSVNQPASGQPLPMGPFYASGTIYQAGDLLGDGAPKATAKRLGTYRISGWIYDNRGGMAITLQSFDFGGRGEIVAGGMAGANLSPIIGATGEFTNGNGQVQTIWINRANFSFRAQFDFGWPQPIM
jgi:hypothetical protein